MSETYVLAGRWPEGSLSDDSEVISNVENILSSCQMAKSRLEELEGADEKIRQPLAEILQEFSSLFTSMEVPEMAMIFKFDVVQTIENLCRGVYGESENREPETPGAIRDLLLEYVNVSEYEGELPGEYLQRVGDYLIFVTSISGIASWSPLETAWRSCGALDVSYGKGCEDNLDEMPDLISAGVMGSLSRPYVPLRSNFFLPKSRFDSAILGIHEEFRVEIAEEALRHSRHDTDDSGFLMVLSRFFRYDLSTSGDVTGLDFVEVNVYHTPHSCFPPSGRGQKPDKYRVLQAISRFCDESFFELFSVDRQVYIRLDLTKDGVKETVLNSLKES